MKRLLGFFLFLLFGSSIIAQETIFEEKTTLFSEEYSGGISIHTSGFGLNFRYAQYQSGFTKRIYAIEFATLKHPKEIKSISQFEDDVKGYIYGKLNSFFTFRPSIGTQHIFIPKQSIRGVAISYVFQMGPSLGLAKPIYLNIRERELNTLNSFNIVKRRYDPEVHGQDDIYGRASFFNGIDELKLYPGIFSKFGLHFDYAKNRETLRSVEVGLTSDLYFQKVPIMALTENRAWFLNIYINLLFGTRELK